MSLRAALLAVLLAAAVATSWWLLQGPGHQPARAQRGDSVSAGYYLRDATIFGTGESGEPLYSLHAGRIEESPGAAGATLIGVDLEYSADRAAPWRLHADEGSISADGQTIELAGNVVILEINGDGPEPTRISMAQLTLDVATHQATTTARVRIQRGNNLMDGTGMEAFLSDGLLRLQSDVHGQFNP